MIDQPKEKLLELATRVAEARETVFPNRPWFQIRGDLNLVRDTNYNDVCTATTTRDARLLALGSPVEAEFRVAAYKLIASLVDDPACPPEIHGRVQALFAVHGSCLERVLGVL